jgi:hypothetical protein
MLPDETGHPARNCFSSKLVYTPLTKTNPETAGNYYFYRQQAKRALTGP